MTFCDFSQIGENDLSIHVHLGYFGRFRHPLPGPTCLMTSLLLVSPLGRLTLAVHGLLLFVLLVATACAGVGPRSLFWGSTQVRAAAPTWVRSTSSVSTKTAARSSRAEIGESSSTRTPPSCA